MTKRERVMAVINGQTPDRTPCGFWLHFPSGFEHGPLAVKKHMDFFERSDTDICKVMNENLLPDDPGISCAPDWSKIRPFSRQAPFIQKQVDLVKQVCDAVDGQAVVLATIHGVVASISHILGGGGLYDSDNGTGRLRQVKHMRENPSGMRAAYEAVTEILQCLVEECLAAGADGIYYAALGAESYTYTEQEFMEWVKPADLAVMAAAKNKKAFNVLHMCKDNLCLSRYSDYPGEVVNWGVYEQNLSLTEGKGIFPGRVILGGLDDRKGVLVDGSAEDIRQAVHAVQREMAGTPFILGADCTLPTEIDYERIRTAAQASLTYRG